MRGKARLFRDSYKLTRITPAYAGKRMNVTESVIWRQDHPRLCGEKPAYLLQRSRLHGSPPPMRGKANDTVDPPEQIRITPAYAGKS